MTDSISAHSFIKRLGEEPNLQVLDVRSPEENSACRLPGSLHIPVDQLGQEGSTGRLGSMNGELFLLCKGGLRAVLAQQQLSTNSSLRLVVIEGGLDALVAAGCKTEGAG